MALNPPLFASITSLIPGRKQQKKPLPERKKDYEEAAMFATLGGRVAPAFFDPPFELRGYRLLVNTVPTYTIQNDNQTAQAGDLLNAVGITIADAGGAGVRDVPVVFEIEDGSGKVNNDTISEVFTNGAGAVAVIWKIVGPAGTKNTLRAWAHGFSHLFTATVR